MTLPRDWRAQLCPKCGHEWARFSVHPRNWFCARCEWPPYPANLIDGAVQKALEAHEARIFQWIREQETLRSGDGSWAKAQRSILRNLREFLKVKR